MKDFEHAYRVTVTFQVKIAAETATAAIDYVRQAVADILEPSDDYASEPERPLYAPQFLARRAQVLLDEPTVRSYRDGEWAEAWDEAEAAIQEEQQSTGYNPGTAGAAS